VPLPSSGAVTPGAGPTGAADQSNQVNTTPSDPTVPPPPPSISSPPTPSDPTGLAAALDVLKKYDPYAFEDPVKTFERAQQMMGPLPVQPPASQLTPMQQVGLLAPALVGLFGGAPSAGFAQSAAGITGALGQRQALQQRYEDAVAQRQRDVAGLGGQLTQSGGRIAQLMLPYVAETQYQAHTIQQKAAANANRGRALDILQIKNAKTDAYQQANLALQRAKTALMAANASNLAQYRAQYIQALQQRTAAAVEMAKAGSARDIAQVVTALTTDMAMAQGTDLFAGDPEIASAEVQIDGRFLAELNSLAPGAGAGSGTPSPAGYSTSPNGTRMSTGAKGTVYFINGQWRTADDPSAPVAK